MARLTIKADHNKFAILNKAKGHERYDSMVDFLQRSKIHYALTHSPDVVYESMVKQFWASATKRSDTELVATVEGTEYVVTESFLQIALLQD